MATVVIEGQLLTAKIDLKGITMIYAVDSHLRSWCKSITWRIIGIFILGGLAWLFTRSWQETTMITVTFHGIRLVLYYFHERVWEKTSWGKKKEIREDYQI